MAEETSYRKFGTFEGVFTPTLLTILGVILFARLGWVVGNAGFIGAVSIILISNIITLATSLSASTMTTNIRIEAGGAYSIISKSLGLEAGGAIGISLYFAQTLSVALYVFGFAEAVRFAFPSLEFRSVLLFTWIFLWIISSISTRLAFRIQFFILALIALSLISFITGALEVETPQITLIGEFAEADFGKVYSIFFPAVTGILAGLGMSGDLKHPQKNIPRGLIGAIALSIVVYIGCAFLLDYSASPETLTQKLTWMLSAGKWQWLVVAGMMGATLSSGLGSIVSSPRLLQAMAVHRSVPLSRFLAFRTKKGEPITATFISSAIIGFALFYGSLDAIAPFITIFFLITYSTINLSLIIEQNIGIASFRPTFHIPKIIPIVGFISSTYMMFYIDFLSSLAALLVVAGLYIYLVKRGLKASWGDVRHGIFRAIVEWASRRLQLMPHTSKSWKPNVLIPIERLNIQEKHLNLISDIAYPGGSLHFFKVTKNKTKRNEEQLERLLSFFNRKEIYCDGFIVEADSFIRSAPAILETMSTNAIAPNSVFLTFDRKTKRGVRLQKFIEKSISNKYGLILLGYHNRKGCKKKKRINLWLRERSPDWDIDKSPNWNLAILTAYRLASSWNGKLNICMSIKKEEERKVAEGFLENLISTARLPLDTGITVLNYPFMEALAESPEADINIFGIGSKFHFMSLKKIFNKSGTSCLFIRDSGFESALI